jgi:hypothetical protein
MAETTDEKVLEETTEEVLEETTPTDTTEYTREKQMIDFERANAQKARADLASITEAYEGANSRIESLQSELDSIKTVKDREQEKLDDMDPDFVDAKVIANIKRLETRLLEKENQISTLLNKASEYERERAERAAKQKHNETKERVLDVADELIGAQYRTEALRLADELVDTGKEKQPTTEADAIRLMIKCYRQVETKQQKKKNGVSVDGGKAGVAGSKKPATTKKTGNLDEVYADMLADKSWKQD